MSVERRRLERRDRLPLMQAESAGVQAGRDIRMFGTKGLFANGQGPLVERFGLGVLALSHRTGRQIVQARRDIGWSGPRAFSLIASDRLDSGSASAYLP